MKKKKNNDEPISNDRDQRIINRSQRRTYFKQNDLLKQKSKLVFKEWCDTIRETQKNGKSNHRENENIWINNTNTQLQRREEAIIKMLQSMNYTKAEIDKYLGKWYDTLQNDN